MRRGRWEGPVGKMGSGKARAACKRGLGRHASPSGAHRRCRLGGAFGLLVVLLTMALTTAFAAIGGPTLPAYAADASRVSDDVFVRSGSDADKNFGTNSALIIGKGRHAYVRLDVSGLKADEVTSASLNFTYNKGNTKNTVVATEASEFASKDGAATTTAWASDAVTYNTRPLDVEGGWSAKVPADASLKLDVTELVKKAVSAGKTAVTLHLTTADVDNDATSAVEYKSSRAGAGPALDLKLTTDAPEEPSEQVKATRTLGTNYLDNASVAQKVFKMKTADGTYLKVADDGHITKAAGADDASVFALYVSSYDAYTGDNASDQEWAKSFAAIKDLASGKYLTIQNYGTKKGQSYYNAVDGATALLATAPSLNWNERLDITHHTTTDTYSIASHLGTYRDNLGYYDNLTTVSLTDAGLVAKSGDKSDVRFTFEDVTGADPLEPRANVSGDTATVTWFAQNGDANPANYVVSASAGTSGAVTADGDKLTATVSGLAQGKGTITVTHGNQKATVDVRVSTHPGVFLSSEQLDAMKNHVANKEEPWYSDYLRLRDTVPNGMSSADYQPSALAATGRGDNTPSGHEIATFEQGGNAAYFNALQWVITGEDTYADAAVRTLNAWSDTLQIVDGRDRILGAGINGYRYINAAEILHGYNGGYAGYSDADFDKFKDLCLNVLYPVVEDLGAPMVANGNWDTAAMVTVISIGALTDNAQIYDRAIDAYQSPYVNGSIVNYVSEWGQSVESMRDQAHAQLGIGYMADVSQIAENQGDDLWGLYDNRLAKAFNWAAEYNLYGNADDASFKAEPLVDLFGRTQWKTLDEQTINRGELRPVYEAPLAHYAKAGVDTTWMAKAAEAMRPQGYVHNDNLNFGTLTSYNGEASTDGAVQPYFQLRTRLEPWYQRTWGAVEKYGDSEGRTNAETLNSYYTIASDGQLTASSKRADAPFFQLVTNDDGTYSVRSVATGKYLSVKADQYTDGTSQLLKVDADRVGDTEKFTWASMGAGYYYLQSAAPAYQGRLVQTVVEGNASDPTNATLRFVLGTKVPTGTADIKNEDRFEAIYNTKDVATAPKPDKPNPDPDPDPTPDPNPVPEGAQRIEAESFDATMATGNVTVRKDGDVIPLDAPQAMSDASGVDLSNFSLSGASQGEYVDFSTPVHNFAANTYNDNILTEKWSQEDQDKGLGTKGAPKETVNGDTASYHVTVDKAGFYKLSFRYNNPATRTKGYRNDRDERNMRIVVNAATDASGKVDLGKFYTDSNQWAGWMIFNISGYNKNYDAAANTSLTPQTDGNYKNVIGNTAWNHNYMNVYLEAGENTITLGTQFPPGQGVYDGANLDYFDVQYVGDQYVQDSEIPYVSADFKFEHPGIYYTLDDLETMKAHKNDADTPWGKGYAEMKASKGASLDYKPSAVETINVGPYNNPNIGGTQYTNDGNAALYNALLWYLDKDDADEQVRADAQAHAKKAIEILNAWSSTLKNVADGNDLKLRFSIVGPDYVNAAEMLKHVYNADPTVADADKWQQADMDAFNGFLDKLLAKTREYYPQANGNWDALIGGFNMAAAVYLDDTELFNEALVQRQLGNIQGGATASMGSLPNYVYENGEGQESSRDQTHARMGISGLAYQSEIAWNQGIDLYSDYGNRLLTGAAYTARYLNGENVDSKTFISDKGRTSSDIASMVFEILSNHYATEAKGAANDDDLAQIEKARDEKLRSGGTKNEAKASAMWYGAMMFSTDASRTVTGVTVSATNGDARLDRVGDTVTLTAEVVGNTKVTDVRWKLPEGMDTYVNAVENADGSLTLTLTKLPTSDSAAKWTVTATSVKDAGISGTLEITSAVYVPSNPGGGGSVTPGKPATNKVQVPSSVEGGTVTLDKAEAAKGDKVTVTLKADATHRVWGVKVTDAAGKRVDVSASDGTTAAEGSFSFAMPDGKVTVKPLVAPVFSDADYSLWYANGVDYVAASGLMVGYGDGGVFGVGKTLTRGEMATILYRYANPGANDDFHTAKNETGMADVEDGQFYTVAANWAVKNGVVNGYANADGTRTFGPNDPVTFEQFVAILANLTAKDEAENADTSVLGKFTDSDGVDAWAAKPMAWAAKRGLVNGYANGDGSHTLGSKENVLRERAAAVFLNAYNLGVME